MNLSQTIKVISSLLTLGALASTGCTFYTACPTANANPNTGGSGNGGSSGMPTTITDGKIPSGAWVSAAPDLGDLADRCGPIFLLSSHPSHDEIIAGAFNTLWSTHDGGTSWAQLGQGKGSFLPNNRASAFVYDPTDENTYWEAGIYGDGLIKTVDDGDTFARIGDITHTDSVAIDLTDSKRRTMLATGHEVQLLKRSLDAGQTWEDITDTLPSGVRWCRYTAIIDANTFLVGCGGGPAEAMSATLLSSDGGDTWTQVFDDGGGAPPLFHSDGTIYWPMDSQRGLAVSTDQGATWEARVEPELLYAQPVELPDGRIASLTNQRVVVSSDGGKTWKNATPDTPWVPTGFTYSAFQKAFFIFYFSCSAEITKAKGDEVMRFDFDFENY